MDETPEATHASSGVLAGIREGIEVVSVAIEVLAIGIIVVAIILGTVRYWRRSLSRAPGPDAYGEYKVGLARSLLLGLEILVAADVIRTVALDPTPAALISLGLLVLIRTFLSWTLVLEAEGRWPWQQRGSGEPARSGTESVAGADRTGVPGARPVGALAAPSGDTG
jgi:uncharacterized membrane protein